MSFKNIRHFSRIYNAPLLIEPGHLDAMLPVFDRVLRGEGRVDSDIDALVTADSTRSQDRGLRMVHGNIAVVDISGIMFHKGRYDADCNYFVGYQDIARWATAARDDEEVAGIATIWDTPGGEVSGCFPLAELFAEIGQVKPIWSMVNDLCCSAGYAIASQSSNISSTGTGVSGSIGVVLRHVEYATWLKREGIKVTQVYAGARKVDGNPYEPLPEEVRGRFQERIDALYEMFVSLVANGRNLPEKAVSGTEADVFMGDKAVDAGFVDRIETADQMLLRFSQHLGNESGANYSSNYSSTQAANLSESPGDGSEPNASGTIVSGETSDQESDMTVETKKIVKASGNPAPAAASFNQADLDAAATAAATAERERIMGIVKHPSAMGRLQAAIAIASVVSMTVEGAGTLLDSLPETKAEGEGTKGASDKGNPFADHMAKLESGQTIGGSMTNDDDGDMDDPNVIQGMWAKARGQAS